MKVERMSDGNRVEMIVFNNNGEQLLLGVDVKISSY